MMATAANTISRTVTAVTTTAPWSWTSWLELFRARLRQLVDHGDDHARALHVGDPHRRAGGDRRPVGRLGPPLLPVDAHEAHVPARRDVAEHDGVGPEEAPGTDAGVVHRAVEAMGDGTQRCEGGQRHAEEDDPLDDDVDVEERQHGGDQGTDGERQQEERPRTRQLPDGEHRRGDDPDPAPVLGGIHLRGKSTPAGSVTAVPDAALCLLTVHAHPDDEASKGAGTVARYHASGVRTVLVTCTGGEAGDILNPAMDRPEVVADLPAIRRRELARAAEIIGYDEVVMLGYRDSGMPDTEPNQHPDAFAPCQPLNLYYSLWSHKGAEAMHRRFLELGLDSPFSPEWFERPSHDDRITTSVDLSGFNEVRLDALLAHETQVDPMSPFWFGLPRDEQSAIHPYDDYILARSLVDTEIPESDLFAGVPSRVGRRS